MTFKTPQPHLWIFCFLASINLTSVCSAATAVETHGSLAVSGSQIVNEAGEAISLAGASLFWSNDGWGGERYYRENVVRYLQENWNATLVRASMGVEDNGGYLTNPSGNQAKVETVVDAAIANGMYVIIDWHSHHAEDHPEEAVTFFQEMATKYGETENVIYEIYNEPLRDSSWTNDVKPYAERVIAAIRAIDPDNLIIVGSPSWSQAVHQAAANPITGYENIAYTLHFYAGTHGAWLRNRAKQAMNDGIALFVTEWGTVNADGDGAVATAETEAWVAFMRENKLSHANWAFNDKVEGASILVQGADPSSETFPDTALTQSGKLVKEIVLGWDSIDYDNDPRNSFEEWLEEHDVSEGAEAGSDPFNTGRSLFFDFAFGVTPTAVQPAVALHASLGEGNALSLRFPAMQPDLDYVLEVHDGAGSWTEVSRHKGVGDWIELEVDPGVAAALYAVRAIGSFAVSE